MCCFVKLYASIGLSLIEGINVKKKVTKPLYCAMTMETFFFLLEEYTN